MDVSPFFASIAGTKEGSTSLKRLAIDLKAIVSLLRHRQRWRDHFAQNAQGDLLGSAAGMHESIRPVAGRIAPLALMGVRCFWPHNMIGHEGLVVDQAWKFAVLADEPSGVTSRDGLRL